MRTGSVLIVAVVISLIAICVVVDAQHYSYPHTQQLVDDNGNPVDFHLFWHVVDDTIRIKISAKTTGWIGFGLSPNEEMPSSDVVIGWVSASGNTFFDDRFAVQRSQPPTDLDQGGENNVQLLSINSVDGWTTIEYSRLLVTGDLSTDVDITSGVTPVAWAMGYSWDNPEDGVLSRHEFRAINYVTFIEGTGPEDELQPSCSGASNSLAYSGDTSGLHSLRIETLAGHIEINDQSGIPSGWVEVNEVAYTSELLQTVQTKFISGQENFWAVYSQRGPSSESTPSTNDGPTPDTPPQHINKEIADNECVAADYAIYVPSGSHIPIFTATTYEGNIFVNNLVVSETVALKTVGGAIEGVFSFSDSFADFEILSDPSSIEIVAEKKLGFNGYPRLVVYAKGFAGNFEVITDAGAAIMIDGDLFDVTSSTSTSKIGYAGYKDTNTNAVFKVKSSSDVEVIFIQESDSLIYDITMQQYKVPSDSTSYICTPFELPTDSDYHAIRFDAIIDQSSVLHHIVLYICSQPYDATEPWDCSTMDPDCINILYVWAVGGSDFYLPQEAGFPIGKNSAKYGIMQMHYDNPNHLNNVVDSSGIRMYYTEQLRQYDAGIVEIGVSEISIPPGESAYLVGDNKFGCPASCTNSHVPEEGKLTVFASMLHAHLAGRQIWTQHYRQDEAGNYYQIEDMNHNIYYDFNLQEYTVFDPPHTILPGDALVTYCVYNTEDRNTTTTFGLPTTSEMCYNFLAYYPLADWSYCLGITDKLAYCDDARVASWSGVPNTPTLYEDYINNLPLSSHQNSPNANNGHSHSSNNNHH